MKKKLLLLTVLVMTFMCLFVISSSASKITTYDDAPAKTYIKTSTDDLVVFYDGFTCPSAYIFKDIQNMTNANKDSALANDLDFTYIKTKTGKTYTIADIKELDVPEGIKNIGGRAFQANTTIKRVSFPKTVETSGVAIFQGATGLEECVFEHGENDNFKSFPGYAFYNCSNLKAFSMPDCVTSMTELAAFTGCKKMTAFHFSNKLVTWYSGGGGSKNATFDDCEAMYFVNDAFTYDAIPEKPTVYYFPEGLTISNHSNDFSKNSTMRNCKALNDILVFGTGVTSITNDFFFQGGPSNTVVFLGNMEKVVTGKYWGTTTFLFANEADKSLADLDFNVYVVNTVKNVIFCNAQGGAEKYTVKRVKENDTEFLQKTLVQKTDTDSDGTLDDEWHIYSPKNEKNKITPATCITNEFGEYYCFCNKHIRTGEVPNTKTGIHECEDDDNCTTPSKVCTSDANCTYFVEAKEHNLTHTLVYANGFDKAGVYNYYCSNENCVLKALDTNDDGIADSEIIDQESPAIIVFKGYSIPEKANYKGLNAGFEIDKTLLTLYEKVNDDTVKFNLLMVNSETSDKQNISAILDGEELAENVKGINIKITSTNYCDIDVSVRGFDDSAETGNFYSLKLITALAVTTKGGVHYAQGALQNSPNTTIDVGGTLFNIVTANNVYNPVNS